MAASDPATDPALEDNTPSPTNVLKESNGVMSELDHEGDSGRTKPAKLEGKAANDVDQENASRRKAAPLKAEIAADSPTQTSDRVVENLPIPSLSEIPPGPDESGFTAGAHSLASTALITPNPLTPLASFVTPAKAPAGTEGGAANGSIIVATGPVGEGSIRKRRAGRRWTAHEDAVLKALVEKNGQRHWKKCAREFQEISGSVRSDVQCLHRWNKCLRPGLVKGQWSPEEDAIIVQMIKENGGHHNVRWSVIAKKLKGRLGKQVRERWINHLDPTIVKKEWSPEEDEKLYQLQMRFGNRWKWIAELMPGRSENGVKNRWHSIKPSMLARKDQDQGDGSTVLAVPKNPSADPHAVQATARTMTAAAVNAAVNAIASKQQTRAKRAAPRKGRAGGQKRAKKSPTAAGSASRSLLGTSAALSPAEVARVGTLADLLSIGQQFAAAADQNLASAAQEGSNMNLQEVAEKAKELLRMSESYREMARAMLGQQTGGRKASSPTSPQFNAHLQQEIADQISKHFGDLQAAAASQDAKDKAAESKQGASSSSSSSFGTGAPPPVQTSALGGVSDPSASSTGASKSPQDHVLFTNYLTMFADTIKNASPSGSEREDKATPTSAGSPASRPTSSLTTPTTATGNRNSEKKSRSDTGDQACLSPHEVLAATAAAVQHNHASEQPSAA